MTGGRLSRTVLPMGLGQRIVQGRLGLYRLGSGRRGTWRCPLRKEMREEARNSAANAPAESLKKTSDDPILKPAGPPNFR